MLGILKFVKVVEVLFIYLFKLYYEWGGCDRDGDYCENIFILRLFCILEYK